MFRRYIDSSEKFSILECYLKGLEKTMKAVDDHDKNDMLYAFIPHFSKIIGLSVKFWHDFDNLKAEQNKGKSPVSHEILEFGRIAIPAAQDFFVYGDDYPRHLKQEIPHLKKRSSPFLREFDYLDSDMFTDEDWPFLVEKSAEAVLEGFYAPPDEQNVSTGAGDDRNKHKAKAEMGAKPKFF